MNHHATQYELQLATSCAASHNALPIYIGTRAVRRHISSIGTMNQLIKFPPHLSLQPRPLGFVSLAIFVIAIRKPPTFKPVTQQLLFNQPANWSSQPPAIHRGWFTTVYFTYNIKKIPHCSEYATRSIITERAPLQPTCFEARNPASPSRTDSPLPS